MPAAVHLTAAVLSGEHPDIDYTSTKTWVMPFGVDDYGAGQETRIGSLDLLVGDHRRALFGDGASAIESTDALSYSEAVVPDGLFDLVIMNPPFTRPTNHENKRGRPENGAMPPNPAFAGLGNDDIAQQLMGYALDKAYRLGGVHTASRAGDGNAGLASNFVDLAHRKLRSGGILALIVPVTVVSGGSWDKTRRLLAKHYEDIAVVTLASVDSSTSRAFSNDTNMAEAVVVATKRKIPVDPDTGRARYICLRRRPATNPDGVDMARINVPGGDFDAPGGSYSGFAVPGLFNELGSGNPSGVHNPELCGIAGNLLEGLLRLPSVTQLMRLPIIPLRELGCRGTYHLDINKKDRGPFEVIPPPKKWCRETPLEVKLQARVAHSKGTHPTLWSQDAWMESRMIVQPCSTAVVRDGMEEHAQKIWNGYINRNNEQIAGATRLHINNNFRLTSQPLGACMTPGIALGGQAWPSFALHRSNLDECEKWEKALCVWLNSTLGLVGRWWVSSRQQNGRARLSVTSIGGIPVLDLRTLTQARIDAAAAIFDEFENLELLPANEAFVDRRRHDLDSALVRRVLHLPEYAIGGIALLREMWCREPSVHGKKSTRPAGS